RWPRGKGIGCSRPSPFLASCYSSEQLVCHLLPGWATTSPEHLVTDALEAWKALGGSVVPSGPELAVQRVWDDRVCTAIFTNLLARSDPVSQARLLAAAAPGSGAWLQAFPLCSIGLLLSDQEFRIASGPYRGPLVR